MNLTISHVLVLFLFEESSLRETLLVHGISLLLLVRGLVIEPLVRGTFDAHTLHESVSGRSQGRSVLDMEQFLLILQISKSLSP